MRRAAVVLALAIVAALLLLSRRGGLGGRAEPTPVEETRAPEAPSVSEPAKAPAWRAVGDVNAPNGAVEVLIEWEDGPTSPTPRPRSRPRSKMGP